MLTDARTPVSWRARPRSFVALMGLYESNFIRLGWLVRDFDAVIDRAVSRATGDCELLLEVLERSRYTTTLRLTYLLPPEAGDEAPPLPTPDLLVRVYRDAHLAEVVEPGTRGTEPAGGQARPGSERELHQRWTRNMLLNKWLEYCVERGHRFGAHRG